jgi:hypothetical protein
MKCGQCAFGGFGVHNPPITITCDIETATAIQGAGTQSRYLYTDCPINDQRIAKLREQLGHPAEQANTDLLSVKQRGLEIYAKDHINRLADLFAKHERRIERLEEDVQRLQRPVGATPMHEEKPTHYCLDCKRAFVQECGLHEGSGRVSAICPLCEGTNTQPLTRP